MKIKHKLPLMMAIAWALSACSETDSHNHSPSNPSSPTTTVHEENSNLPVYQVVTDATYPPFDFTNDRGQFIGFDMDLLNAIAADQGFRVQYRLQLWDGMFDELKNNQAHIIASAISISDNEDNIALLSKPYIQSHDCVVAHKPEKLVNWQTHKIAIAQNEDLSEDLQEKFHVKETQLVPTATPFLGLKAIVAGQADVVAADCTVLTYHTKSSTFAGFTFHHKIMPAHASQDGINLVFGVNKQHPELLEKINQGLENVKKSGQYDQILSKWRLKNAQ